MTPAPRPCPSAVAPSDTAAATRRVSRYATLALLGLAFAATQAHAQSTVPAPPSTSPPVESPGEQFPVRPETPVSPPPAAPSPTPPAAQAAIDSSVRVFDDTRSLTKEAVLPGRRAPVASSVLVEAGTGAAVGEGSRVLKVPGACTPKTNSLDCVADAGPSAQGANVSSRVRNSVIGEVGAGRGATEGGGNLKREGACTPLPGQLSC
ncbi:MAG: hypothetical protein EOP40_13125 [Rubrivivax sp.]|nr:MAG: hypothetical protein EOP40_13125 [Rubrivivax sp.]